MQGQSWALGEENGVWNSPEQSLAPGKDKADPKISEMDKLVDELQKVLEVTSAAQVFACMSCRDKHLVKILTFGPKASC